MLCPLCAQQVESAPYEVRIQGEPTRACRRCFPSRSSVDFGATCSWYNPAYQQANAPRRRRSSLSSSASSASSNSASTASPSVAIVLAPGRGFSREALAPLARALRARTRGVIVAAIDLPGHGSRLDETCTVDACAAAFREVVETASAKATHVYVFAHGLAGYAAVACRDRPWWTRAVHQTLLFGVSRESSSPTGVSSPQSLYRPLFSFLQGVANSAGVSTSDAKPHDYASDDVAKLRARAERGVRRVRAKLARAQSLGGGAQTPRFASAVRGCVPVFDDDDAASSDDTGSKGEPGLAKTAAAASDDAEDFTEATRALLSETVYEPGLYPQIHEEVVALKRAARKTWSSAVNTDGAYGKDDGRRFSAQFAQLSVGRAGRSLRRVGPVALPETFADAIASHIENDLEEGLDSVGLSDDAGVAKTMSVTFA